MTLALSPADLAAAFGAEASEMEAIAAEAAKYDFRYRRLDQDERDRLILSVLDKLASFTQVGEHRHSIWEMAWGDVAKRYDESRGDLSALEPSFIGGTKYLRLQGDYAKPADPAFEFNFFRVLRSWLFRRYLGDAKHIYEFGCGSGFNLAALAEWAPDKHLVGLDWAKPAVELIDRVAGSHGFDLKGRQFDFFHPDPNLALEPGSVAMTFCALEQTGERFGTFVDWLLERRPALVISMEPIAEFYDPALLVDALALRYHTHRKYLSGYYTALRRLADEARVEILHARRLGMGSLYHEGFSLLVWRPV